MNTTFIGNPHAVSYFEKIIASKQWGFILLTWPQYIGKTTVIMNNLNTLISPFHMGSDYRFIQDFSDIWWELKEKNDKLTGTEHIIKIENDSSKQDIKLEDGSIYQDRWAREIIDRLGKSPIGWKKLLIIENIERMTTQASNALLKTLEEPLPDRIIIATSSKPNTLLDTIKSRAIILPFTPIWTIGNKDYSMGRPGLARRLEHLTAYQELRTAVDAIMSEQWRTTEMISSKQGMIMNIHELWLLDLLLDILLVQYSDTQRNLGQNTTISQKLYHTKKILESNVGIQNVIMNLCL